MERKWLRRVISLFVFLIGVGAIYYVEDNMWLLSIEMIAFGILLWINLALADTLDINEDVINEVL